MTVHFNFYVATGASELKVRREKSYVAQAISEDC